MAFGNGYKIVKGARNDYASRSPMRSAARHPSRMSRDLFIFPMYIYIIFSCIIYIYIFIYVFIDLRANKYYGIWQILSYVKKLFARKACLRTWGSMPAFRHINRCNDIVSDGNVLAASSRFSTLCFFPSLFSFIQKCNNLCFTKLTSLNFTFNFSDN